MVAFGIHRARSDERVGGTVAPSAYTCMENAHLRRTSSEMEENVMVEHRIEAQLHLRISTRRPNKDNKIPKQSVSPWVVCYDP